MKIFLFTLIICLSFSNVFSNEINLTSGQDKLSFVEVIDLPEASKEDLYNICITDFIPSMKPASKLIWVKGERNGVTVQSPETKELIIARHSIDVSFAGGYSCILYNLKFEFKEGKLRYSINDIILSHATAVSGMTTETLEEFIVGKREKKKLRYLEEVNMELNKIRKSLIDRFKSAIKNKKKNDDW